jgi:hypothetical protein
VFAASVIRKVMKAASAYETSVNFYQITRLDIPEDIFILAALRS